MAYYVSKGAKLKCPMGSEQSELEVVHLERPVLLRGEPMANIMDFKPMMNIKPFGRCCSLMNPVVAAATAANYGRLQEMPCIPNPMAPWQGGKMDLIIKGAPALLSTSKCMCCWGFPIEITHPGQDAVYEGGPMTITITDPTIETLQSLESMGGDGVRGASGRGFADLQASLQTAIGGIQLPQIPSFVTEMKGAAETLLQKAVGAVESGKGKSNDIRSSAVADKDDIVKELKDEAKSKVESCKLIVGVESSEDKAFQGQEVTYNAIVYNNHGTEIKANEDCDVRWAIKVGENGDIDKDELKSMNGKRTIAIKMKEEWVDKKEITIMPYLNSPDKDISVRVEVKEYTFEDLWLKIKEIHNQNMFGSLCVASRNSLIKDLMRIIVGTYNNIDSAANVKWQEEVQKYLEPDTATGDFLKIKIADQEINGENPLTSAPGYQKAGAKEGELIIGFNVRPIINAVRSVVVKIIGENANQKKYHDTENGVGNKMLQAYFIHELRHFWQYKNEIWQDNNLQKRININTPDIRTEVDAFDIQFKFESYSLLVMEGSELKKAFEEADIKYKGLKLKIEEAKIEALFDKGKYNRNHYNYPSKPK